MQQSTSATEKPQLARYQGAQWKEVLGALAIPVFGILHRPMFRRAAEMAYDFALRWNGFAIGFRGKDFLTQPEEKFLQRLLPQLAPGPLLDVGANSGHYAEFMRKLLPERQVIAFEPHPRTFALLESRTAGQRIELEQTALSDRAGTMQLYDFASENGSTQASLAAESIGLFSGDLVAHDVEVTTLDAFASQRGLGYIPFLKIDTEGFDINVLRGAAGLLAAGRIDVIQFEFIPACVGVRVTMRDFFEALPGYDLHRLMVGGTLMPLPRYDVKRHEVYVIHNIVAVRKGWRPRL